MRSYCYCTFLNGTLTKMTGGSVHAKSYDDACDQAVRVNKLTVEITGDPGYERFRFVRDDGRYVSLLVYVNPEYAVVTPSSPPATGGVAVLIPGISPQPSTHKPEDMLFIHGLCNRCGCKFMAPPRLWSYHPAWGGGYGGGGEDASYSIECPQAGCGAVTTIGGRKLEVKQ